MGSGDAAAMPIDKLETLIVLAWRRDPLVEAAHVALPLCDFAEVDGTFTNRHGLVQRIRAAVPPAGDSLPGWEILSLLSDRLGTPMDFSGGHRVAQNKGDRGHAPTARSVFLEAKHKLAFMKDADWGRTSLPIQLRFANTRG